MYPCAVAVSVMMLAGATLAIKGGSKVDMCDYPGIAAIVSADTNTVLCSGVTQAGNVLLVPELCKIAVDMQLAVSELNLKYGNGDNTLVLPKGSTLGGSLEDGVWKLDLPEALAGPCEEPPQVFDGASMELDQASCEMVGFGADTLSSKEFDKAGVNAAPITKSTSSSCCESIQGSVSNMVDFIVDDSATLNCMTSSGAACSVADVGAPIYCDTKSGEKVVVGLAGSASCNPGETFVAHDLTKGDPGVKFGVSPTP